MIGPTDYRATSQLWHSIWINWLYYAIESQKTIKFQVKHVFIYWYQLSWSEWWYFHTDHDNWGGKWIHGIQTDISASRIVDVNWKMKRHQLKDDQTYSSNICSSCFHNSVKNIGWLFWNTHTYTFSDPHPTSKRRTPDVVIIFEACIRHQCTNKWIAHKHDNVTSIYRTKSKTRSPLKIKVNCAKYGWPKVWFYLMSKRDFHFWYLYLIFQTRCLYFAIFWKNILFMHWNMKFPISKWSVNNDMPAIQTGLDLSSCK